MQGGKNGSGQERGHARLLQRIKKPVRQVGIQSNLLQKAKCEVGEETPRFRNARWYAVKGAEPKTCEASRENKRGKNDQALARGGPEIVGPPA